MPKIPIPDDWDGESWQCYVIEWPDSERWRAIFLGQVTAPGKGRFWDERTGTITDVQETGLEIYRRNILGGIMSCFDDLALSVRYLADRLYSKPCCPSAVNLNVVQTVTVGGNTIYGTEEPEGLSGEAGVGDPPAGYETWSEYYTKKCQAANLVADGLISFYNNLGAISIGSAAVVGAAVGLAIPGIIAVPPAIIPLLVAALLGLGVSITVLTSIGGWLTDNRDDLVCLLYESDTVALAVDAFAALIDEALIALAIGSSLHPYVKAVALGMASTDTLNQLFDANLGISYAGADCSGCDPLENGISFWYRDDDNIAQPLSGVWQDNTFTATVPHSDLGDGYPGSIMTIFSDGDLVPYGFKITAFVSEDFLGNASQSPGEIRFTDKDETVYEKKDAIIDSDVETYFGLYGHIDLVNWIRSLGDVSVEMAITVELETS